MSVRLCFLVNVRKAIGRSVCGGRRIGRIEARGGGRAKASGGGGTALSGGRRVTGLRGSECAGVAKAGEDERRGLPVVFVSGVEEGWCVVAIELTLETSESL